MLTPLSWVGKLNVGALFGVKCFFLYPTALSIVQGAFCGPPLLLLSTANITTTNIHLPTAFATNTNCYYYC